MKRRASDATQGTFFLSSATPLRVHARPLLPPTSSVSVSAEIWQLAAPLCTCPFKPFDDAHLTQPAPVATTFSVAMSEHKPVDGVVTVWPAVATAEGTSPAVASPKSPASPTKYACQSPASADHEYESVTIRVSAHCPPALRREKWSVNDFDLRTLMYNGNISMVYHAVDKHSGITVALKLYKRAKLTVMERHQVIREINLHTKLTHPSIIGMYAAWKDRTSVYMVLEWAPGGDVYSYLRRNRGRLSEDVVVPLILEPFMSGLADIHAQGLIHRDVKPENILLNHAYQIKIADFGLSIDSESEVANTRLGTIDYLAPEILDCPVKETPFDNKENPNIGYTNKVDCWSCGVLAYELLVGQPPFAAATPYETLCLIRTKEVEYPSFLSAEVVSFIRQLLVRDPKQRASIEEMLQHPWIQKYSRRAVQPSRSLRQRFKSGSGAMLSAALAAAQAEEEVERERQRDEAGLMMQTMPGDVTSGSPTSSAARTLKPKLSLGKSHAAGVQNSSPGYLGLSSAISQPAPPGVTTALPLYQVPLPTTGSSNGAKEGGGGEKTGGVLRRAITALQSRSAKFFSVQTTAGGAAVPARGTLVQQSGPNSPAHGPAVVVLPPL